MEAKRSLKVSVVLAGNTVIGAYQDEKVATIVARKYHAKVAEIYVIFK